jgi:hypothetical protein
VAFRTVPNSFTAVGADTAKVVFDEVAGNERAAIWPLNLGEGVSNYLAEP